MSGTDETALGEWARILSQTRALSRTLRQECRKNIKVCLGLAANSIDFGAANRKSEFVRGCSWWCGGCLVSTVALAQSVSHMPIPVEMNWHGPEACNGASETLVEIRRMLGQKPPPASATRIAVEVVAEAHDDNKWDIRVTTVARELSGERELKAETCEEARRAVALLVALMIDPDANIVNAGPGQTQSAPPREPSQAEAQVVDSGHNASFAPNPAAPINDKSASAPAVRAFLGLDVAADHGSLPAWDMGARLALGINSNQWVLALRGGAWAPRSEHYASVSGAGANFSLYTTELVACVSALRADKAALQVCAGPELLVYRASSYGVTSPGLATSAALGALGELALKYGVGRGIALRLALQGVAALQRPQFAIRELGRVFQPQALAERVSLGLEFEF